MSKSQPIIYLAATGHGFGHAVRLASVADVLKQLNPNILLILVTTAPRWLLESYIQGDFIYRPLAFDVGVIQADSLNMDKKATLQKMQDIFKKQQSLIASEVNFIRTNRVDLILADIPPLMASIAKAAGIPCWMMGNVGWDFIYREWGQEFQEIIDWISQCYQQCDRLFRLPMAEPMTAFNNITNVGLTGGNFRYNEAQLRDKFKLNTPREKTILLTFGGLGLQTIPYHNLIQFEEWKFITFDRQSPDLPNLIKVTDHSYRPVDFMPLCGRVICKPGFSTFSEAMRLEVPIISLTRDDFAETPFLLEGIQDYSYHQIINTNQFYQGNWDFLLQSSQEPRRGITLPKDGSEVIAREVLNYFT